MIKLIISLGKLLSFRNWVLIFFLLTSAIIVSTWFENSILYGGAEVGIFTFNPQRWFEISRYVWWGAVSPGQLIPHFITSFPLYLFFYALYLVGLSSQSIQQVFFLLMLFLMGYGMFLLAFDVLGEDKKKYALAAGIFYLFNVYTLVQVWHRFLYSTIFLAAVLPFLILFWRRWINKGKFTNLSIFLIINILSSYIYGNLASVITVWVGLFLITLAEICIPWQDKINFRNVGFKFLLGFIFWILINSWWIIPTFSIAPGLLSAQHTGEDNLSTLVSISKQTIMPYLLQMANPYYLFYHFELGVIYSNIGFKLVPWIMSFFIFLGLIKGLTIKSFARISIIFVIVIILSKGAAPPFSYPFIFGFEHSYFLGVLRNPFEKLGILLPLFGALLFAVGLEIFFNWGIKRFSSLIAKLSLFLVIVMLVGYAWPMFGGSVFGTKDLPLKVKIPESYIQADAWLKRQAVDQGVILHLPFSGGDVVTYKWEKGYHGVDQNEILFTSLPSLSRVIGIERIDNTLKSLTNIFRPNFSSDKKQILRLLQLFNIRYIVLHKDIKWDDKDTYGDIGTLLEPNSIEKVLDSLDFAQKQNQFGQLVIYKLNNTVYKPTLSFTDNTQVVYPGKTDIMQVLSQTKDNGDIITPFSEGLDPVSLKKARQILIYPNKKIEYFESSPSAMISNANDNFNKLLQVNNFFLSIGDLPSQKLTQDLIASTSKITQITSVKDLNKYKDLIQKVFDSYSIDLNIHKQFGSLVADVLRLHILILNQIGDTNMAGVIEDKMIKWEMIPRFKNYGQTWKFKVPLEGNFDLLTDAQIKETDIKINGKSINSKNSVLDNKGDFEISYSTTSANIKSDLALRLTGKSGSMSSGEILSFIKESPVNFKGTIRLEKEGFVNFAQSFHPGWTFTLSKDGENYNITKHFIGNLYENTWFVDNKGDFNFKIEFSPQKNVNKGLLVAGSSFIILLLINLYSIRRKFTRK